MLDLVEVLKFAPFVGLGAGILVGSSGVGGAALATPLLLLLGVPAPIAIATDAAFCAVIKVLGIGAHRRALSGGFGQIGGMAIAAVVGALLGAVALGRLATVEGGEALLRRALGVALVAAAAVLAHRILRGGHAAEGVAWLPRPIAILLAGVLGFFIGLTSIGAGSLLLPLLFVSVRGRFDTIVGLGLALGLVVAITTGVAHLGAGNANPMLLFALVLGGAPGVFIGARLHRFVPAKALASTTATLIGAVGLRLVF